MIRDVSEQENALFCIVCRDENPLPNDRTDVLEYFKSTLLKLNDLISQNRSEFKHKECHQAEKSLSKLLLLQCNFSPNLLNEITMQELQEEACKFVSLLKRQDLFKAL